MKRWRRRRGSRQLRDDPIEPAATPQAVCDMRVSGELLAFINVPLSDLAAHHAGIRNIRWIMSISRIRLDPQNSRAAADPTIKAPGRKPAARPVISLDLDDHAARPAPQDRAATVGSIA